MKILKNIVVGSAIASLAMSASAAVIQFSWTGSSGVVTGTIDLPSYAGNGTYNETGATLLSLKLDGVDTVTGIGGGSLGFDFTFTGGSGSLVAGSPFSIVNGGFFDDVLSGTQGVNNWKLDWEGSADVVVGGATDLVLTVVPEPETYAAVAGAGLVAFGLFRRRAVKA